MTTREEAKAFREVGRILYMDPEGQFDIRAGDVFEGETIKGTKNLVVALRIIDGWMLYSHSDKVRKVRIEEFVRSIESGDLELKYVDEIDTERLHMAQIGLDALANRRTWEEALQVQADQAEAALMGGRIIGA